jgi:dTDP-glucose 4,6-dehydratase
VFVTGGTGFFGRWLVESALHANRHLSLGLSLVVLTRNVAAARERLPAFDDAVELHEGDVSGFAFPTGSFDAVVHAATESSTIARPDDHRSMYATIVHGTARVLDFVAERGAARLLYVSTGAVYGRQPPDLLLISETYLGGPDPLVPASAYAEGKRAAELQVAMHAAATGCIASVARGFAFVGPGLPLDAHFAVGNFIGDALADRDLHIRGDGSPWRSYLHAADMAAWLWTILARGASARAYNVGSEDGMPLRDVAARVGKAAARVLKRRPSVHCATVPVEGRAPERYMPSTARARAELGLDTWISLDAALDRTIRWHASVTGGAT